MCFARLAETIVSRWWRSRSGNIAIVCGICAPMLIGFCGFGADAGYWFYQSRQLQAAADIAAYDGAVVLNGGGTGSQITSTATTDATTNGWVSSQGTITVNNPPKTGSYQNNQSVEVLLTENVQRYFTAIYSTSTVTLSARAVSTIQGAHVACVVALNATKADAINVSGGGILSSPNCDVVSDSSASNGINLSGGAQITTPCLVSVGGVAVGGGATVTLKTCKTNTTNAPVATDPYKNVSAPTPSGSCITISGRPSTLSPGYYCHGISITWGPVTFQPGVYYVTGGNLTMTGGASVSGTGVTFYIVKGNTMAIGGGAVLNFSAPTSGIYSGLVFFGDRTATSGSDTFSGGANTTIQGAIYFPTQNVSYSGGTSGSSVCTQLIADTVTATGGANFNNACTGDGVSTINVSDGSPGSVKLGE